jgi:hypothetical protein
LAVQAHCDWAVCGRAVSPKRMRLALRPALHQLRGASLGGRDALKRLSRRLMTEAKHHRGMPDVDGSWRFARYAFLLRLVVSRRPCLQPRGEEAGIASCARHQERAKLETLYALLQSLVGAARIRGVGDVVAICSTTMVVATTSVRERMSDHREAGAPGQCLPAPPSPTPPHNNTTAHCVSTLSINKSPISPLSFFPQTIHLLRIAGGDRYACSHDMARLTAPPS